MHKTANPPHYLVSRRVVGGSVVGNRMHADAYTFTQIAKMFLQRRHSGFACAKSVRYASLSAGGAPALHT
jgi:hypothetical protein